VLQCVAMRVAVCHSACILLHCISVVLVYAVCPPGREILSILQCVALLHCVAVCFISLRFVAVYCRKSVCCSLLIWR